MGAQRNDDAAPETADEQWSGWRRGVAVGGLLLLATALSLFAWTVYMDNASSLLLGVGALQIGEEVICVSAALLIVASWYPILVEPRRTVAPKAVAGVLCIRVLLGVECGLAIAALAIQIIGTYAGIATWWPGWESLTGLLFALPFAVCGIFNHMIRLMLARVSLIVSAPSAITYVIALALADLAQYATGVVVGPLVCVFVALVYGRWLVPVVAVGLFTAAALSLLAGGLGLVYLRGVGPFPKKYTL